MLLIGIEIEEGIVTLVILDLKNAPRLICVTEFGISYEVIDEFCGNKCNMVLFLSKSTPFSDEYT
jgi:hypothetical protein